MSTAVDFSKRTLAVITGASRGIGRSIAIETSRKLSQDSILVLMARNVKALEETKAQIMEIDRSLTVLCFEIDLSKPNLQTFEKIFSSVVDSVDSTAGLEFGVMFHNAGHVGRIDRTSNLTDLTEWQSYFDLNYFSVVQLNSVFLKWLRPLTPQLVVVNVTSKCGRSPFQELAMYGSCKAARDLFFKVMAVEEPNIIILNYSPGPVDTEMFESIIDGAKSEEVKKDFESVKKTVILTPVQTVGKMLELLESGKFKSGDIVDYFDLI